MTAWIALDDMDDPKIGSLEYAIGSHRWDDDDFGGGGVNGKQEIFRVRQLARARRCKEAGAGDPEIIRVSIKAGDAPYTMGAPFMGQAQTKRSDLALVSASTLSLQGARFKADSRKTFASV